MNALFTFLGFSIFSAGNKHGKQSKNIDRATSGFEPTNTGFDSAFIQIDIYKNSNF